MTANPDLLLRWLADEDGKSVKPYEARNAEGRQSCRLRETMIAAKDAAEAEGDTQRVAEIEASLQVAVSWDDALLKTRLVYDVMSRVGHSRRSGISDAVSPDLRQMATGPHPDPRIRAEYVDYGGLIVEEVALAVGDAIERFYQHDWYLHEVKPLVDRLSALRETSPLIF